MKVTTIIISLVLIFIIPLSGNCQYLSYTPETDSLVALGINQIHYLQLDSAVATFERLIEYYPDHPMGYFYKAAIYSLFNQNYRITVYDDKFEEAIDQAIDKGESYTRKNKKDALGFFYLGGAYGFRGLHEVLKKNWIKAFVDGYKGIKNLQHSLDMRPDLYDAYFGLGMYHYWRSAKTKVIRFLPMVADQRQQGIDELKLTIEKGRYAGVEARFALESIYYNEAEHDSALQINNWLYNRFSFDPSVLYTRAKIYEKTERWQDLIDIVGDLMAVLNNFQYQSTGYKIECHYLLALAYTSLNSNKEALQHLETALQLNKERNKDMEVDGPYEDFDDTFDAAKDLYEDLKSSDG